MTDIQSQTETVFDEAEIREQADRFLSMNEFVVAYEEPLQDPYYEAQHRGYLMAFVHTGNNGEYERVQFMSGDDDMIRRYFGEMASQGVSRIETFIGE